MKHVNTSIVSAVVVAVSASVVGCATSNEGGRAVASPPVALHARDAAHCHEVLADDAVQAVLRGDAIESVSPLYGGTETKTSHPHLDGAALRVRPLKGETPEWLERGLECHRADTSAAGAQASSSASDPFLSASGSPVEIRVLSDGDGFLIHLSGRTPGESSQILARAQALAGTPRTASLQSP